MQKGWCGNPCLGTAVREEHEPSTITITNLDYDYEHEHEHEKTKGLLEGAGVLFRD